MTQRPLQEVSTPKSDTAAKRTRLESLRPSMQFADRTLRCRFEMKYHITESQAAAVEHFVQPYLHLDRYCKLQPTGTYPIVSLYLDSDNLRLCQESMVGKKNRFKLRIRSYTDDPNYPKFFEIKRRMNTIIIKDRERVMQRDIPGILERGILPAQYYSTEQDILKQFLLYKDTINAGPTIRVRYLRRAYEDDSDNRVRVTFDHRLSYKVTDEPDISLDGSGWHLYCPNGVILEIKFTGRFPAWLNRMVKCFNLRQQSFSKYVNSVKGSCSLGFCAPKRAGLVL